MYSLSLSLSHTHTHTHIYIYIYIYTLASVYIFLALYLCDRLRKGISDYACVRFLYMRVHILMFHSFLNSQSTFFPGRLAQQDVLTDFLFFFSFFFFFFFFFCSGNTNQQSNNFKQIIWKDAIITTLNQVKNNNLWIILKHKPKSKKTLTTKPPRNNCKCSTKQRCQDDV